MGLGLIIIPLSILAYFIFMLWSISFYAKTKKQATEEDETSSSCPDVKTTIVWIYVIALLSNDNLNDLISGFISIFWLDWSQFAYWFKQGLTSVFLNWDDWIDIAKYWFSMIAAFLISYWFGKLLERHSDCRVLKYNVHQLSLFLLILHPFVVISIVGRLFGWEPLLNEWLS